MEIDYVGALETASWYSDLGRRGMKFDKTTAVKELAHYGLFKYNEIGWVLGVSESYVGNLVGWPAPDIGNRVWKVEALYVLWLIATEVRDGGVISPPLAQLAAEHGTSIKAISQLTGAGLDEVREAVYGKPNLLDLLRAGADSPSD